MLQIPATLCSCAHTLSSCVFSCVFFSSQRRKHEPSLLTPPLIHTSPGHAPCTFIYVVLFCHSAPVLPIRVLHRSSPCADWKYMWKYMCEYAYMCIYMDTYIYRYKYMYMCVCVCIYLHIYIYIYIRVLAPTGIGQLSVQCCRCPDSVFSIFRFQVERSTT